MPLNCSLRCPEAQPDVLVPSPAALADFVGFGGAALVVEEDVRLLLESTLALHCQFRCHDCEWERIGGCCESAAVMCAAVRRISGVCGLQVLARKAGGAACWYSNKEGTPVMFTNRRGPTW